jgi:hypothetical protein
MVYDAGALRELNIILAQAGIHYIQNTNQPNSYENRIFTNNQTGT